MAFNAQFLFRSTHAKQQVTAADMDKREKWIEMYGAVVKKARALTYLPSEVFEPMNAVEQEYPPTLKQAGAATVPQPGEVPNWNILSSQR